MNNYIASIGDDLLGPNFLNPAPGSGLGAIGKLVSILSSNAIMIAGVILIFIIIYAGSSMITASGDPQEFARARSVLTAGITGFVIVLAAWFIIKAIETSTGVGIL